MQKLPGIGESAAGLSWNQPPSQEQTANQPVGFAVQDLDYGSRIGSSSPMYGVSQKCRAALKTLRHRNRQRFFSLSSRFDSRGQALKVPSVSVKHGSDNRVHPVDV